MLKGSAPHHPVNAEEKFVTFETQTILWAFLAAFLAASTNVTLARVLAQVGSFTLAQIANIGNAVFLGIYGLWIFDISIFRWEAFAWFGVLGVTNFCMNRWVFYNGMKAMGPSRHVTITSMVPLPTLLVAMRRFGAWTATMICRKSQAACCFSISGMYVPCRAALVSRARW